MAWRGPQRVVVLALGLVLAHGLPPLATRHPSRCGTLVMAARPKKSGRKSAGSKPKVRSSGGFGFGAGAAAPHAVPEVAVPAEWRELSKWLISEGASVNVEVAIVDGIRGVRARRALKPGDEVMRIPRSLIMDEAAVEEGALSELLSRLGDDLPAYVKLALQVLHERRLGAASLLAPYVSLLPTPRDFDREGGPAATWGDDELALCECPKLAADAARKRSALERPALSEATLGEHWQAWRASPYDLPMTCA